MLLTTKVGGAIKSLLPLLPHLRQYCISNSYRFCGQPSGLWIDRKLVIGGHDRVSYFGITFRFILVFGIHTKDTGTCKEK